MNTTIVQLLLVIFLATLIRSTFGFGEALIAVPLLALSMPIEIAAPVAVLVSITIAAIVVAQDWRQIHVRSTGWLLAPTFVGIPFGVALLTSAHQHVVKAALGIVIVLFSGYFLLGSKPIELRRDSKPWLLGCGFVAGVLGGAYGMNGPPLVIYGAMRRWSPSISARRSRDTFCRQVWSRWRATGSPASGLLSSRTIICCRCWWCCRASFWAVRSTSACAAIGS